MPHPSRRQVLATALAAGLPLGLHAQPAPSPLSKSPSHLPRLITIDGSITEVVYALGAEAQLVGTDTTSLYPKAAQKTPKVGYMRQLSAEGVLSLKPDAVISTTEAGPPVVLDQLRSAGVKVELVKTEHTWNDVKAKVSAVGRAAQREEAARELQTRLDAEWAQVTRQVAAQSKPKPRVLFILSHGPSPQVAGLETAADAMIRYAGGVNPLSGFKGYRPMTAEAMAGAAPDFILTTDLGIQALGGIDKFWQRPELALTPAYRKRAVVVLDALLLLSFGPRLPQAVQEVHSRLYT
ncbi:heme/hemin ABC transporter substrate-binding protein [Ottowia sp.]|uniref:heme/hemin ABC transporter substrate-binding protein n=1 Tax=Ottowia sp. TaxID=1898956 RepID=UPI003C717DBC